MSDSPKFQWSKFSPDGRSEQVVVRSDNAVEWAENIKIAKSILPQPAFPNDEGPVATKPEISQEKAPICPIHNKPMRQGKYPGSWFCATPVGEENGKKIWCKSKPKMDHWE